MGHKPQKEKEPKKRDLEVEEGVLDWDLESGEVFYSEAWKRLLGYGPEEIGSSCEEWWSRVHPEERERVEREWNQFLNRKEEGLFHSEQRLLCKGGEYRWLVVRGVLFAGGLLKVRRFMATFTDIDRERRWQETRDRSSEELRKILNAFPDLLLLLDGEGKVLDFQAGEKAPLLILHEGVQGKAVSKLFPPSISDGLARVLRKTLEKRAPQEFEFSVLLSGSEESFEARFVPFSGGRVLIIVRQITRRKIAERALMKLQAQQQALLDNLPFAVWMKDKEGRFEGANSILLEIVHKKREELVGLTEFDFFPKELAQKLRREDMKVMRSGKKLFLEERNRGVSQEQEWVEVYKAPVFGEKRKILGIVGFSRDITERKEAERLVQESEENLRSFFDTVNDFLFILDSELKIIVVNRALEERLGYQERELRGQSATLLHPPGVREKVQRQLNKILRGEEQILHFPLQERGGSEIPVETKFVQGRWSDQKVLFCVSRDMTERVEAERLLRISQERFSRLFHLNPTLMVVSEIEDGTIVDVNKSFLRVMGFKREEVVGFTASGLGFIDSKGREVMLRRRVRSQRGIRNLEVPLKTAKGERLMALLSGEVIESREGVYYLWVMKDITLLKRAQVDLERLNRELQERSIRDGLTKLFNHRHIFERLEEEIGRGVRYQEPLSVIMGDIDHFKDVNDTYGHGVGDKVLESVAGLLKKALRKTDILGRYGGEEFLAVLPRTPLEKAGAVAERIRRAVEGESKEASGVSVTISLGVALYAPGDTAASLIDKGDDCLYRAKREGRNRAVVEGEKPKRR